MNPILNSINCRLFHLPPTTVTCKWCCLNWHGLFAISESLTQTQSLSVPASLTFVQYDQDSDLTRRWHVTISCQPDGRPPQPVRPWKSGRVHLAEGSNVVVLQLPYSTEFGRKIKKFASGVQKYGKFSHFLSYPGVYGGQGKKQILSSLSTANVYRLSRVKVSGTCIQPFQRYRLRSANFDKFCNMTRGSEGFVGQSSPNVADV